MIFPGRFQPISKDVSVKFGGIALVFCCFYGILVLLRIYFSTPFCFYVENGGMKAKFSTIYAVENVENANDFELFHVKHCIFW